MGQPVIPPTETKTRPAGPEVSTSDLFRLDQRTIVLTGGCGGIGSILESGGDVVCIDRPEDPPQPAWSSLEKVASQHDGQAIYRCCDVTDEKAMKRTLTELAIRHPLRGLVACVGQSDNGAAINYSPATFRRLLDTNIMSTFIAAQACAEIMQSTGSSGSMVLIASMSGHVVNKGADSSAYNTAKSGVLQLGRSLASEWGARKGMPLIRVNTLSPGYIKTAATVEALKSPGIEEFWSSQNMLNRMSYPDEFRAPIVFLLSDGSSFMTGADLRVDGGHCAW